MSATDGSTVEAWLENKAMCFTLHGYDLQHEGLHGGLQLKGSALLWWKMLLPQLNMVVEAVLWERFGMVLGEVIVRGIH
jgi:hypothetical protein